MANNAKTALKQNFFGGFSATSSTAIALAARGLYDTVDDILADLPRHGRKGPGIPGQGAPAWTPWPGLGSCISTQVYTSPHSDANTANLKVL